MGQSPFPALDVFVAVLHRYFEVGGGDGLDMGHDFTGSLSARKK